MKGHDVKMVAFGDEDYSYIVLYESKQCAWWNIHPELENYVKGRRVDFVSMGALGEYFVRFEDGSWRSSDFKSTESSFLMKISDQGNIREVSFLSHGIIIRYNGY